MNELRVSVIIPAYRAAGTIGRAVESVLRQTYLAAEVLVIDDGSPDDIAAAVAPYGERITLVRQPNLGAARARNTGLERATGDLIAFLDADDYWEPQKLERHVDVYRCFPEIGLSCGTYFTQLPGAPHRRLWAPALPSDRPIHRRGADAFDAALRVWTGTVVVPRSVLGEERFVSGLEPAEDRHLWVRLIGKAPIYSFSEPLATAVLEAGSLSRTNADRDCGNMLRVVREYRDLLGRRGTRQHEARVFGRWAGVLLSQGQPREAVGPAASRLLRDPATIAGWWVLGKAFWLTLVSSHRAAPAAADSNL